MLSKTAGGLALILGFIMFLDWRSGTTPPTDLVLVCLGCAFIAFWPVIARWLWRRSIKRVPKAPKPLPQQPVRRFAVPPTVRVAEPKLEPAVVSMDDELRRFAARGMKAIREESSQR